MQQFVYKNIFVQGISVGGVENCYALPKYHVGFDIGRCPSFMTDIPNIFLSHGHLDHAAGVPYYFSQRSLRNISAGNIYVPQTMEKPLKQILTAWQEIEGFQYPMQVHGLQAGDDTWISKSTFVRALPAFHRVSALGYILYERKKKLKQEFLHLKQEEIIAKKNTGEQLTVEIDTPLFAYSGDSSIEFILENPQVLLAKVLFLECTYIDDERPVQRARDWGHIHLYEIIEHADLFQNDYIVLVHFSRRYSLAKIENWLKKKLPPSLHTKIRVFNSPTFSL